MVEGFPWHPIILEACQKAVKLVLSKEYDYALMQMFVKSSA